MGRRRDRRLRHAVRRDLAGDQRIIVTKAGCPEVGVLDARTSKLVATSTGKEIVTVKNRHVSVDFAADGSSVTVVETPRKVSATPSRPATSSSPGCRRTTKR